MKEIIVILWRTEIDNETDTEENEEDKFIK